MTSSGALTKANIIPRFNEDEEMKVEANHSAHDSLNSSHEKFHSDLNLEKVGLDLQRGGSADTLGRVNMSLVHAAYPTFKDHLMVLLKAEICHEVLLESGVGRTLKFFYDYCISY